MISARIIYFIFGGGFLKPVHAGIPVVPFFDLDGTGGSLRNVDDEAAQVTLSSPPLLFGSANFTTAYVSTMHF